MKEYLEIKGIKLSRSFIELDSGIEISKILPKIIECLHRNQLVILDSSREYMFLPNHMNLQMLLSTVEM